METRKNVANLHVCFSITNHSDLLCPLNIYQFFFHEFEYVKIGKYSNVFQSIAPNSKEYILRKEIIFRNHQYAFGHVV